jgi:general secretion pathway protein D
MRTTLRGLVLCACAVTCASVSFAQSPTSSEGTVSITSLIADIAKTTGKNFIVDPRVRADVTLIQKDKGSLSYADLLTVLQVHGYTAVEGDRFVTIVPDANIRQLAPLVRDKDKAADAEYVTKVMTVRSMPAATLVPMLRPMMPQQSHLAASICSNDLVIVDTAANVRRIESLVQTLDDGEPFKPRNCAEVDSPAGEARK